MTTTLAIVTDDPEQARQLLAWLRRESELRGVTDLRLLPPRQTGGHLGEATDTVLAILSNPGAITAVATTIGVWLGQRVGRTRIRVKDGEREVEIETTSRRRAEEYTRTILAELNAGPADSVSLTVRGDNHEHDRTETTD
ncbi:effector-associated constant component EACC1 [Stackebrandtia nassauensis]|uniref:Uncharacterized protein n=1 Tax=Stackebrandtia nassauensis (strain DSM 44728 / CIP 108903 / NRRL B-16338 / NBRC 102104 / LLR-40K-21) TaxID=446470 RepID=D3Q4B8_STANL|nr:hypothetical protein [Stackebrandtia nassauensis]ADD40078.1 hypothetical protein Snas_0360 [Stackebrandtia nassauensis DSM 44728]